MTSEKKVYVVYNGDGMSVFTIMKDAIDYATLGGDVYDNEYQGVYDGDISMTSIRRDLRDWTQVSAYDYMGNHFTITPTVLHKRGSTLPYLSRGVA
jgi:FAD synthase